MSTQQVGRPPKVIHPAKEGHVNKLLKYMYIDTISSLPLNALGHPNNCFVTDDNLLVLQDRLKCSLCFEVLNQPLELPCKALVCAKCIKHLHCTRKCRSNTSSAAAVIVTAIITTAAEHSSSLPSPPPPASSYTQSPQPSERHHSPGPDDLSQSSSTSVLPTLLSQFQLPSSPSLEGESQPATCCKCHSSGARCTSCKCCREERPCVNCYPGRRGKCTNITSSIPPVSSPHSEDSLQSYSSPPVATPESMFP